MSSPEKDFIRDQSSRALINTNRKEYERYKTLKERNLRLDKLEYQVSRIESMLEQLLNRK